MLVIGRRTGETVCLGDDIEIRIMELSPSRVKLGIVAPKQLCILRGEIRKTAEANRAASQGKIDALSQWVAQLRRS